MPLLLHGPLPLLREHACRFYSRRNVSSIVGAEDGRGAHVARFGILRMGLLPLVAIARSTAQTEVVKKGAPPGRRWYDVIDFQREAKETFRAVAVGATRFRVLGT